MQAVIPAMKKTGGGSIVNIASTAARRASAPTTIYGSSKAALVSLTKAAAVHLAETGSGIRVNAICPGAVDTEFMRQGLRGLPDSVRQAAIETIPLKRAALPEDISGGIVFLVSDESAFVTGTELFIDGGTTAV
jgi:3alpha(or 20beta)-hydroxysteroid dehydrogenase